MALKKGSAKEVKQYEASLLEEAILVKDTTSFASMDWESYCSRLAIFDWEEYEEEEEEEDDLEPVDDSCHECGGRSRLGVLCEKCIDDDEEHDDDQVTCIEKYAYYVDWEEEQALWYEDVEAALSASKTLIRRFKKRKTNYERKDLKPAHGAARRAGRRIKASWVR